METSDPKYKHKPSEKHTLEEVLKSLQDLIRNDLDEGAAARTEAAGTRPAQGAPAAEQKPRREPAAKPREDFAPATPGGPVNLDAVLRSLKDLVGNELNVGDEPAAAGAGPASAHDEYLATPDGIEEYVPEDLAVPGEEPPAGAEVTAREETNPPETAPDAYPGGGERIEEYIPEGLDQLDGELILGDEPVAQPPGLTVSPDEPSPPPEIVAENLPQEFAPLDEELTFDQTDAPPPAPPVSATTELPGEISSELLEEPEAPPEAAPPPAEPARAAVADAAPGMQQELLLDEPPPIELRLPATAPEPAPDPEDSTPLEPLATPETPAAPITETPAAEAGVDEAMQALPTIEVEEDADAGDYFDGAALSAEAPPASLEELAAGETEIPVAPETPASPVEPAPAAPADAAPAEPAPAPEEKKITLEIAEPAGTDRRKPSVDFDAIDLAPPAAPEQAPPPAEEPPAVEAPPLTLSAGAAPEQEPVKPAEAPPVTESRTDAAPGTAEPPPVPAEPAGTDAPASFSPEDFPVLSEVVAPPAGGAPVAPAAAKPLPAPDRARDLVVRAVAKLNVEMRKAGGTGLDTKTILRLQQLIRQELEKGGDK